MLSSAVCPARSSLHTVRYFNNHNNYYYYCYQHYNYCTNYSYNYLSFTFQFGFIYVKSANSHYKLGYKTPRKKAPTNFKEDRMPNGVKTTNGCNPEYCKNDQYVGYTNSKNKMHSDTDPQGWYILTALYTAASEASYVHSNPHTYTRLYYHHHHEHHSKTKSQVFQNLQLWLEFQNASCGHHTESCW